MIIIKMSIILLPYAEVNIHTLAADALSTGGDWLIFKIQQYQVREAMIERIKEGVPDEELTLLKIPQASEQAGYIFQLIYDREFRYEGKMYDIVRREIHGDTTWYYCISDEAETVLFANLNEVVNREVNQNPRRKQQSEKLQQLLNPFFVVNPNQSHLVVSSKESELTNYQFALQTWINTPSVPPPQV